MFLKSKAMISYFCAFLTIILWGTLATVSKILLGSLDAMLVLAFTCDVSAVLLFIYNLIKGNIKRNTIGSIQEITVMCLLGFVGFFLYNMFYLMGINLLPSQQAMIINYLWPAMIIVFSCIFLKEKMTAKKALAIALSFVGIIIVAVNGNLQLLMNSNLKGVCFCLLAAVSYGFYAAINKGQSYNKEIAMMFAFATAGIIATVTSVINGSVSQLNTHILPGLLYDAVFVNAIGYTSWMIALEYGNTATISNLAYLTPFVSLVFARVILNEQVSVYSLLGLGLIISGIAVQFVGNKK